MDDQEILDRIQSLADAEHELLNRHGAGGLSDEEHRRLSRLEERLDQAWDLLRRRRTARRNGLDPEEVAPRDLGTVEDYLQ